MYLTISAIYKHCKKTHFERSICMRDCYVFFHIVCALMPHLNANAGVSSGVRCQKFGLIIRLYPFLAYTSRESLPASWLLTMQKVAK